MKTKKPRVCFYCEHIYPLLDPNVTETFIGGAELQQLLIARELQRLGYDITFIAMDYGQGEATSRQGFNIFATYHFREGLPVLRFVYPKLISIWRALRRSDAEIYYLRGAAFDLAPIVLYARRNGKKVVFCGADDPDFDPKRVGLGNLRDKAMFYWGLRRCNAVVAQNHFQRQTLWDNFRKRARVIYNGFPRDSGVANTSDGHILWVATFRRPKRPERFLELARRVPGGRFVMVGGSLTNSSMETKQRQAFVEREAALLPNLMYKGTLPIQEVEEQFRTARLFVNTSDHEGFPNTFLQAWSKGVPVISFVDPDHLIERHGLGVVVKDLDGMAQGVRDLLEAKIRFSPERIKAFFDANLAIDQVVKRYDELFTSLAQ